MSDDLLEVLRPGTAEIMKAPRDPAARVREPEPEGEWEAEQSPTLVLEAIGLDTEYELPAGFATLQVAARGEDELRVVCRAAGGSAAPIECDPIERPNIALADIAREGGRDPGEVLDLMWAWSQGVVALTLWLAQLVEAGAARNLIIIDDSRCEIPWELLALGAAPNGHGTEGYLGAKVAVTRWQAVTLAAQSSSWLDNPPAPSPGPVVAYLNKELRAIETDVKSLTMADVRAYHDVREFERAELQGGTADRSLVYFACHGKPGASLIEVSLGSLEAKDQQLTLGRLERRGVRLRCPVFLNACHSARFIKEQLARQRWLRGFPDLFLRGGAPGVIGTVGEINDEFAAAFAKTFLMTALAIPEAPLPEILRHTRAQIVGECNSGEEADEMRLVCAFMYVYYGNPRCRVAIRGRQ